MSTGNGRLFDPKVLEAFQAVMACGSMTRAAEQLGMGQPAVTRMVKELEAAVGFELFHRNGPRISPTDRGLRFYDEVQRVLAGLHQIGRRAEAIRHERVPALDIAATPTMAGGLLGPALGALGEAMPDHVNVQTMSAEAVIRALRGGTADVGIAADPIDHAGLVRHVGCRSRLVAAVPSGSPHASRGSPVPLSVFRSERLVTVGNAFRIRRTIDRALEREGIVPSREFATNSSLNAVMAARAGLGVAIVDPVTAHGIPVEGVAILPLEIEMPYRWALLSDAGRAAGELLTPFVAAFRRACEATVPGCTFEDPERPAGTTPRRAEQEALIP